MAIATADGIEGLRELQGRTIGPSEWREVTQEMINTFAELSGDHQWIHVDAERATGFVLLVNYGWNKVRFPAPVPAGSKLRASAEVIDIIDKGGGWYEIVTRFTLEVEGNEKPAFVGDSVGRTLVAQGG